MKLPARRGQVEPASRWLSSSCIGSTQAKASQASSSSSSSSLEPLQHRVVTQATATYVSPETATNKASHEASACTRSYRAHALHHV